MTKKIAVIGAGIIGVSTAIELQRAGHSVVLIDRDGPAAGASFGNGGVLASAGVVPVTVPGLLRKAPAMLFDPAQPLFLKWRYLPRLLPWLARYLRHANAADVQRISRAIHGITGDSLRDHQALASGTDAERFVLPSDYVFLYRNRQQFEADAFGWSVRAACGVEWDEFEAERLVEYDPVLGANGGFAIRLRGHGRISDPGAYIDALARHFISSGGQFLKAEAIDLAHENGQIHAVQVKSLTGSDSVACDDCVIALGAWSGGLTRKLGLKVPLESERGYHLDLWEPNIMPRSPVMVAAGKFVITPMEGRLRLAGIVEFGGLSNPPSRAPFRLLHDSIRATIPALQWRKTTEWMGHRPAPTDSIPVIGPVPGICGAWLGFGHHHIGLTGGPRTGKLIAQMIDGQKSNADLAPYAPMRFRSKLAT